MIKCAIFDIGGVVIDFDWEKRIEYLVSLSKKKKVEYKEVENLLLGKLELGLINLDTFQKEIANLLGIKKKEVKWVEYYKQTASVDPETIELVEGVHEGCKTAFLSNIDASHYLEAKNLFDFELFDYKFASCYIHLRKPDPEIFRYALKKMKLKPKDAIFIDNQIENVVSARSIGIRSILFKDARTLCMELAKLNLL